MKVAIVDYGVGNVANVDYALTRAGYEPVLTKEAAEIKQAPIVLLPGVGAAAPAMAALEATGLVPVLRERVEAKKLLVGICLGMQLLYDISYEDGAVPCLGFLPGRIEKLTNVPKIPHMGWNELVFRDEHPLAGDLPSSPYVYFVHSYGKIPPLSDDVLAYADYNGQPIPGIVTGEGLIGMQFHPEKSGAVGHQLLVNLRQCL